MSFDSMKARAIALIKNNVPFDEIATECEVPEALVREWSKQQSNDLVAVEATLIATERVLNGEVLDPTRLDKLKDVLEEAAIEITKEISAGLGDPMYAKSVELCASTVAKLYSTIIMQGQGPSEPLTKISDTSISTFETMLRD